MADELLSQSLANISKLIAAAGALGTGAYGLIDSSKAIGGGMSNPGFGHIQNAVERIIGKAGQKGGVAGALDPTDILATLRANWLNGVAKIRPEGSRQIADSHVHNSRKCRSTREGDRRRSGRTEGCSSACS
jgi:hypothetical protein